MKFYRLKKDGLYLKKISGFMGEGDPQDDRLWMEFTTNRKIALIFDEIDLQGLSTWSETESRINRLDEEEVAMDLIEYFGQEKGIIIQRIWHDNGRAPNEQIRYLQGTVHNHCWTSNRENARIFSHWYDADEMIGKLPVLHLQVNGREYRYRYTERIEL